MPKKVELTPQERVLLESFLRKLHQAAQEDPVKAAYVELRGFALGCQFESAGNYKFFGRAYTTKKKEGT